jgi:uncharacterized Ntn-hydrolase superfamily protein
MIAQVNYDPTRAGERGTMRHEDRSINTFSIVARDGATGDFGVAVQSKFLAAAAVVSWAQANVGAVATQAHANVSYGPRGLALLASGLDAEAVIHELTASDPGRAHRQIGVVDRDGRAATFTGDACMYWAGGIAGDGFCAQGNILVSQDTVEAMASAYQTTEGSFSHRLLSALEAGQAAGGDSRGQQSAGILVVRERGGYGGGSDRLIDLRVDDAPEPIAELRRLVNLHRVYFNIDDAEYEILDDAMLARVRENLARTGHLPSDADSSREETLNALARFAGAENLEERLRHDDRIDTVVLDFLIEKAQRSH